MPRGALDGPSAERLRRALDAIDEVNAGGPETVLVDGAARPKELVHAEAMTAWVLRLDPEPSEVQLLAARAHHLRRWAVPRSSYPEGRAGYLRWRRDQQHRHAEEVGDLLEAEGYDEATIAEVGTVIRKEGLGTRPEVQAHEDALCLVFLEEQAASVAADLDAGRTQRIIERTVAKMSPRAIAEAVALPLDPDVRRLLVEAVAALDGS